MGNKTFSKFRSRWWAFCEIDRQIRAGRACSCASLARDLEVDPRTVRRYIAFMREDLGAPIDFDPIETRYILSDKTWTMPNVHLSDIELVALAVATRSMSASTPAPFNEALETLFAKLLDACPEDRKRELATMRQRVDFVPAAVPSKGQQWVESLLDAIRDDRSVIIDYFALSKRAKSTRLVDPYHLRFFAGTWYLVAYDHPTRHLPLFNLARIRRLEMTENTFRRKNFSVTEYFRHSFGISVGGPPKLVRIRLVGRAARTAQERQWPAGFTYTPETDDAGLLIGQVSKLDDVLAWTASFDGEAMILPENKSWR